MTLTEYINKLQNLIKEHPECADINAVCIN